MSNRSHTHGGVTAKQASDNLTRAARLHGVAQINQRPKMRIRPGWDGVHRITIAGHAQELFQMYVSEGEPDPHRALERRCLPDEQRHYFSDDFFVMMFGLSICSIGALMLALYERLFVVALVPLIASAVCWMFVLFPPGWIRSVLGRVLLTEQAQYERRLLKAMRNIQDYHEKHKRAAQHGDLSVALSGDGGELTQCNGGQLEVIDE